MLTIPPDIKCCLSILNIDYQDDFPPDVMCCLHILIQRSASYDMCANKEQRSMASWVKLNVLYDLIKQLRIKCVELHENSWCRWLRSRLLCVNFNNIMSIIDHLKKKQWQNIEHINCWENHKQANKIWGWLQCFIKRCATNLKVFIWKKHLLQFSTACYSCLKYSLFWRKLHLLCFWL